MVAHFATIIAGRSPLGVPAGHERKAPTTMVYLPENCCNKLAIPY